MSPRVGSYMLNLFKGVLTLICKVFFYGMTHRDKIKSVHEYIVIDILFPLSLNWVVHPIRGLGFLFDYNFFFQ